MTERLVTDSEAARIQGILDSVDYMDQQVGPGIDRDSPFYTVSELLATRSFAIEALEDIPGLLEDPELEWRVRERVSLALARLHGEGEDR